MTSSRMFRVARTALLLAGTTVFLTACHYHWGNNRQHHRGDLPLTLQAETPPSNLR